MAHWVKDPALTLQQFRLTAVLRVQSLAWELPCASGAAEKGKPNRTKQEHQ